MEKNMKMNPLSWILNWQKTFQSKSTLIINIYLKYDNL